MNNSRSDRHFFLLAFLLLLVTQSCFVQANSLTNHGVHDYTENANHRGLLGTYDIGFDDVSNTIDTVTVDFKNGDGGVNITGRFEIWVPTSNAQNNIDLACDGELYTGNQIEVSNSTTITDPSSSFVFSFASNITSASPFYYTDGSGADLVVCVKFILTDGATDQNSREIAIKVNVDSSLDIESVNFLDTASAAPATDSDGTIVYAISVDLCDSAPSSIVIGDLVPFCFFAAQYPLAHLDSVETLTITYGSTELAVLASGSPSSSLAGLLDGPQSSGGCPSNECIQYGVAFPPSFIDATEVEIVGEAILRIGRSRNMFLRRLQVQAIVTVDRLLSESHTQHQPFRVRLVLPSAVVQGDTQEVARRGFHATVSSRQYSPLILMALLATLAVCTAWLLWRRQRKQKMVATESSL
ncbi:predicted protein [Phaeodactylum tricornutum CCAP 1055/1]|jgi:hypothetical protein|uniref:Uncharacterized protein n=1 Tax=Phaeodactylum tricornutum (strain CCAP 1055/1) TaxID=556484 RepID=B7GA47_PHATC|nr:predicted protein [Phaeodactylum tricornutum CCAP 1055/1]EEC44674.1 predicted protein [Phaeodactylum tricornutum CCAP 1055/1]|eukprot:XP_002184005.1 predicted protein [Phaeodactylum tricornutum CCAP 1055/1]